MDHDGSAEIVYQSTALGQYEDWEGLTVLGHARSAWAASGPTWRGHHYVHGQLGPNGTVSTTPPTPWIEHNLVRARPVIDDPPGAELRVRLDDLCVASCLEGGTASLAVTITNSGAREAREETPIALYALDGTLETLLQVTSLGTELPAGHTSGSIVFDIDVADRGSDGLVVRVDDDGTGPQEGLVRECIEDDNELVLTTWPCH